MRIGILTGGGDVPGLNPCIKSVVRRAYEKGWTVLGFRRGWAGPLHVDPDAPGTAKPRWLEELTPDVVRTIDRAVQPTAKQQCCRSGADIAADLPAHHPPRAPGPGLDPIRWTV